MDYLKVADRTWPVLNRLMAGHTAIYKLSRGRIGHKLPGLPPILLLDHKGAKSGKLRTSPLLYVRDGDNIVIVASKGGFPKNPAWFFNLRANPETAVQVGPEHRKVRARVASPAERERLWPKATAAYGGYVEYQARAEREIPLVILEPRPS